MYSALPKMERSFDLDVIGEQTGHQYTGTFTVKCVLSIAQKHTIELEKSRLLADQRNPTPALVNLAVALAEIRGRILEGPAWWKDSQQGASLLDSEVIFAIFNKSLDTEEAWRADLKKKADEVASKNV